MHVSHREDQKTCCHGNPRILKRQTLAALFRWALLETLALAISDSEHGKTFRHDTSQWQLNVFCMVVLVEDS